MTTLIEILFNREKNYSDILLNYKVEKCSDFIHYENLYNDKITFEDKFARII